MRQDSIPKDYHGAHIRVISECAELVQAYAELTASSSDHTLRAVLLEMNDFEHAVWALEIYYNTYQGKMAPPIVSPAPLIPDLRTLITLSMILIHNITKLQLYGEVALDVQTGRIYDNTTAMLVGFQMMRAFLCVAKEHYRKDYPEIDEPMSSIPIPVIEPPS